MIQLDERLRNRATLYGRLALLTVATAIAAFGIAVALWTPPGHSAFAGIDMTQDFAAFWRHYAGPTQKLISDGTDTIHSFLYPLFLAVLLIGAIFAVVRRRFIWIPVIIAIGVLPSEIETRVFHTHGLSYVPAASVNPGLLARLHRQAAEVSTVGDDSKTGLTIEEAGADGVITGAELQRAYGKPTSSFAMDPDDPYDPKLADVPILWTHPSHMRLDPLVIVAELHYVGAQPAYLRGDAVTTRAELEAIAPADIESQKVLDWRVGIMQDWVRAQGLPVSASCWRPPFALERLTPGLAGLIGWAGLVIGLVGLGLAAALAALVVILKARVRRLSDLLSGPSARPIRSPA